MAAHTASPRLLIRCTGILVALVTGLAIPRLPAASAKDHAAGSITTPEQVEESLMAQTVAPRPSQGFAGQNSGAFGAPSFLGVAIGGFVGGTGASLGGAAAGGTDAGGEGEGDGDSQDDDEDQAAGGSSEPGGAQ